MADVQVRGLDDGDANETLKLKSAEGEVGPATTGGRRTATQRRPTLDQARGQATAAQPGANRPRHQSRADEGGLDAGALAGCPLLLRRFLG